MKKSDMISRIKDESNNIEIPDLTSKILSKAPTEKIVLKEKKYKLSLIKKLTLSFSSLAVLIILVIMLIKPGKSPDNPINNDLSKYKKTYAIQAVTLLNFADDIIESNTGILKLNGNPNKDTNYEDIADEINKYLFNAEQMFNQDKLVYEIEQLENKDYEFKMEIEIPLLNLEKKYTLYYNEYLINNQKKNEKKNYDEVSSKIQGIIVYDNDSYKIEGFKEVEEDEQEVELKMDLGDNEYLVVKQEIETEKDEIENEYEYEYYKNDKKINSLTISYEIEDDEKTIEIESKDQSNKSKSKFKFCYKNNYIDAKVSMKGFKGEKIKIELLEKEYKYNFGNDNYVCKERKKNKNKGN